jgi:hypothetical protein
MKGPTPVLTIDVDPTNKRHDANGRIHNSVKVVAVHHQAAELIADKVRLAMRDEFGIKVPLMVSGTDIFFRPEPPDVTAVMQTVAEVAHQIQTK